MFTVTYMYNISTYQGDDHPPTDVLLQLCLVYWVPQRKDSFYLMLKRSLVDDSCTSTGRGPDTASEADWGQCYWTKLWGVQRQTSRKCTVITEPLRCHQTNLHLCHVRNPFSKFNWTDTWSLGKLPRTEEVLHCSNSNMMYNYMSCFPYISTHQPVKIQIYYSPPAAVGRT